MHVGTFASAIFIVLEVLKNIDGKKKMKKFIVLSTKTLFSAMLLGLLGCVSTGCGSPGLTNAKEVPEVSGIVLLPTGRPLKGGQLILRPCGGAENARRLSGDINEDGTFIIRTSGEDQTIVAADYKVFISLNTDPKHRGLRRLVPEKYRDIREDEFETDLIMNPEQQTSGITLKMTKG